MSVITFEDMEWLQEEANLDAQHYDDHEDMKVSEWYWNRYHMIGSCMSQLFFIYNGHQSPRTKASVSVEILKEYGYEAIVKELEETETQTDTDWDALADEWSEYQASKE